MPGSIQVTKRTSATFTSSFTLGDLRAFVAPATASPTMPGSGSSTTLRPPTSATPRPPRSPCTGPRDGPRPSATSTPRPTSLIDPHLPDGRRIWEIALVRVPAGGSRRPLARGCRSPTSTSPTPTRVAAHRPVRRAVPAQRLRPGRPGPHVPCARDDSRPVMLWGSTEANAAQTIDDLTAGASSPAPTRRSTMANIADLLRRHGHEPSWYHHPRDVPNVAPAGCAAGRPSGDPERGDGWVGASYSTRAVRGRRRARAGRPALRLGRRGLDVDDGRRSRDRRPSACDWT
jgi:hypothetical protein